MTTELGTEINSCQLTLWHWNNCETKYWTHRFVFFWSRLESRTIKRYLSTEIRRSNTRSHWSQELKSTRSFEWNMKNKETRVAVKRLTVKGLEVKRRKSRRKKHSLVTNQVKRLGHNSWCYIIKRWIRFGFSLEFFCMILLDLSLRSLMWSVSE